MCFRLWALLLFRGVCGGDSDTSGPFGGPSLAFCPTQAPAPEKPLPGAWRWILDLGGHPLQRPGPCCLGSERDTSHSLQPQPEPPGQTGTRRHKPSKAQAPPASGQQTKASGAPCRGPHCCLRSQGQKGHHPNPRHPLRDSEYTPNLIEPQLLEKGGTGLKPPGTLSTKGGRPCARAELRPWRAVPVDASVLPGVQTLTSVGLRQAASLSSEDVGTTWATDGSSSPLGWAHEQFWPLRAQALACTGRRAQEAATRGPRAGRSTPPPLSGAQR